jgi:sulfur carrier protein ThiS
MRVRAFIERDGKERTVRAGNVGDLLKGLGINPESVIAARGKDLLAETRALKRGDRVRVIHIKAAD